MARRRGDVIVKNTFLEILDEEDAVCHSRSRSTPPSRGARPATGSGDADLAAQLALLDTILHGQSGAREPRNALAAATMGSSSGGPSATEEGWLVEAGRRARRRRGAAQHLLRHDRVHRPRDRRMPPLHLRANPRWVQVRQGLQVLPHLRRSHHCGAAPPLQAEAGPHQADNGGDEAKVAQDPGLLASGDVQDSASARAKLMSKLVCVAVDTADDE
eukprot:CAMPEP_0176091798 /NCGR_PEP_ID=MMETSP0120_2-20121206/45983_1 /TAXON_ID=160619 /ORGANISM="Kryptoperidinium foliaceum, Strain CCMP 1326" /LENGTH=215 /DNA_ID=CAMNT_0017425699 /DNA_START=6 /DNA_END=654 /DNA_ORIENTATION=-